MSKEVAMNYTQHLNENADQWNKFKKVMDDHFQIMQQQNSYIQTSKQNYEKEIANLKSAIQQSVTAIESLQKENEVLREQNKNLVEEQAHMRKISIYSNLNKQISEQANYIQMLEKRLNARSPKTVEVLSPRVVEEPVHEESKPSHVEEDSDEAVSEEEETEEVEDEQEVDEQNDSNEDVEETEDHEYAKEEVLEDEEVEEQNDSNEEVEEGDDDDVVEDAVDEEEIEDAEEEEVVEDEEPEIEYESRKIGKKYYYVSNEEPAGIYMVIKDTGEVGDKVGEYDDNDKPVFYK